MPVGDAGVTHTDVVQPRSPGQDELVNMQSMAHSAQLSETNEKTRARKIAFNIDDNEEEAMRKNELPQ